MLFAFFNIITQICVKNIGAVTMKHTKSLKLNKDFKRLYYRGKSCISKNVVVYAMKNRGEFNRIGITCGKALGKAVIRNRLKRLVRESYRQMEPDIQKGYDFVFVVRTRAVGKPFSEINGDLVYAMKKLSVL